MSPVNNVDARLNVDNGAGATRQLSVNDLATAATGAASEITLAALLLELGQKLEAGQAVALDAATLAALETITVANPTPAVETGLAKDATLSGRFGGGKSAYAAVISTSGDTTVITPAAGKRVRVYWVSFIPNSDNTAANLVTVKFAGGTSMYVGYAMAHWEEFTGTTNQAVVVNLSNTQPVAVTIHFQEVT